MQHVLDDHSEDDRDRYAKRGREEREAGRAEHRREREDPQLRLAARRCRYGSREAARRRQDPPLEIVAAVEEARAVVRHFLAGILRELRHLATGHVEGHLPPYLLRRTRVMLDVTPVLL